MRAQRYSWSRPYHGAAKAHLMACGMCIGRIDHHIIADPVPIGVDLDPLAGGVDHKAPGIQMTAERPPAMTYTDTDICIGCGIGVVMANGLRCVAVLAGHILMRPIIMPGVGLVGCGRV